MASGTVAQARVLNVADLDGSNGLVITSRNDNERIGYSVAPIGDINGDGIDDLAIGARRARHNGFESGSAYIVFGRAQGDAYPAQLELSDLDGSNGFRLDGENVGDWAGRSVSSAGDINGDGFDDLLVGASRADPNGDQSGRTYVVYGRASADPFPAVLQLGSLDGNRGFMLNGVAERDVSGRATAAVGDINGDGLDDLAIGANGSSPNGSASGSTFVLFGNASQGAFPAVFELSQLDGSNGFRVNGVEAISNSGLAVARAGDFNVDGIDDLIIGAAFANRSDANPSGFGGAFVLFGRAPGVGFPATVELDNFDTGIGLRMTGETDRSYAGYAVDGGADINGDGFDDVVIGAQGTSFNGPRSGSAYVVFGGPDAVPQSGELALSGLNGSNGFRIDGLAEGDEAGLAVAFPGDFNADGREDLLVSAFRSDIAEPSSGSSYVIHGRSAVEPFDALLDLARIADGDELRVDGREADYSGLSASGGGDLNGDGAPDLLIGTLGGGLAGRVYVVFGGAASSNTNYSYTYYNPSEPGWGFNALHQGELLYGTWYTYADDGQVMFLTVEGTLQLDGSFAGPVYRVTGTPLELINGSQAFTSINQVGEASMSFDGAGALALSYTVAGVSQSKTLERFVFDPAAPTCRGTTVSRASASNYSDLWWNPSEAGWGLTLSHQGDIIFVLWYTYGAGGRDQWISASAMTRQADGSYAGALQRPDSGVPLAQIAGPATTFPVPDIGSASLSFSNGENGSFSYTIDGVTQNKAIERFVVVGADQPKPICETMGTPVAGGS